MKKIIITCIMLTAFAVTSFSQSIAEGSLDVLKGQERVSIELDFTFAIIHGMDEENFAKYEEDWEKDKKGVMLNFISEASSNCNRIAIGSFSSTDYLFKVFVSKINKNGDWQSRVELLDKEGNSYAKIVALYGSGGRIGSKINLINDGAQNSGKALGRFLDKALKKVKK